LNIPSWTRRVPVWESGPPARPPPNGAYFDALIEKPDDFESPGRSARDCEAESMMFYSFYLYFE
jgi:hypothetical protein